jgi:CAAX protease family protein
MADSQPWGRAATFGLGVLALIAGQTVALATLTWWYGVDVVRLPDFSGDGLAVTIIIVTSNPVQLGLLALFARMRSASAADYLGLVWPRRSEVVFGIAAVVALIVFGDGLSWLVGHSIVTPFQSDIYRTASDAGWLPLLWIAVVVVTPIGEETLFRGFLFRGWLRTPREAWPVIAVTALLWALMHVQYDWYVIGQVFVSGLLLGWLRWASGSTILTILLHGLINFEGMLESLLALHG